MKSCYVSLTNNLIYAGKEAQICIYQDGRWDFGMLAGGYFGGMFPQVPISFILGEQWGRWRKDRDNTVILETLVKALNEDGSHKILSLLELVNFSFRTGETGKIKFLTKGGFEKHFDAIRYDLLKMPDKFSPTDVAKLITTGECRIDGDGYQTTKQWASLVKALFSDDFPVSRDGSLNWSRESRQYMTDKIKDLYFLGLHGRDFTMALEIIKEKYNITDTTVFLEKFCDYSWKVKEVY